MAGNTDARFARLQTDPRFRRPKQKAVKAEIDERFKDVLTEDFGKTKGKARVDKRGRPLAATSGADEMKRFYRMRSPDADEPAAPVDYARGEGALYSSGSEDEGSDDDSEVEEDELELGGKKKARHLVPSDSEESSDDEDNLHVDLSEDEGETAFPPEADEEEEDEEEEEEEGSDPTTRIAAVNLDWDNLRADDIYTIFNSFLKPLPRKGEAAPPAAGKLLHVRIYPSEFGKERMALEDAQGPGGGIFKSQAGAKKNKGKKRTQEIEVVESESEEEDEEEEEEDDEEMGSDEEEEGSEGEEEEGDQEELEDDGLDPMMDDLEILSDVASEAGSEDIDMDQLRQYQLERLRYYYAIATFSTVAAAELVYDELNGTEFERTANILDLSYVPEDMTFAEDEMTDEATKEPKAYKGNEFVTDALRHSKVKLTWDQDDPNRAKTTRRALTREEIEEQDFSNLVAGSDSEDDDDEEDAEEGDDKAEKKKSKKQLVKERKEKLRALLLADDGEVGEIWGKAGSAWQDELADIKADRTEGKGNKSSKAGKKEDVEITFKPGLTSSANAVDDENLTSLEKYRMRQKEKKQRKKEAAELKRAEAEDSDAPAKENDDFFGDSSEDDEPAPETKGKKDKRADTPEEADDPAGLVQDPSSHFSMKDMLAAEKASKDGKKKRQRKRKGKAGEREQELGPEGFVAAVDVADPRFAAVFNEPSFAVDPTHSKFTDTAANREILKRTRETHAARREGGTKAGQGEGAEDKNLGDLVASVKRKMGDGAGSKRKRSRK